MEWDRIQLPEFAERVRRTEESLRELATTRPAVAAFRSEMEKNDETHFRMADAGLMFLLPGAHRCCSFIDANTLTRCTTPAVIGGDAASGTTKLTHALELFSNGVLARQKWQSKAYGSFLFALVGRNTSSLMGGIPSVLSADGIASYTAVDPNSHLQSRMRRLTENMSSPVNPCGHTKCEKQMQKKSKPCRHECCRESATYLDCCFYCERHQEILRNPQAKDAQELLIRDCLMAAKDLAGFPWG